MATKAFFRFTKRQEIHFILYNNHNLRQVQPAKENVSALFKNIFQIGFASTKIMKPDQSAFQIYLYHTIIRPLQIIIWHWPHRDTGMSLSGTSTPTLCEDKDNHAGFHGNRAQYLSMQVIV